MPGNPRPAEPEEAPSAQAVRELVTRWLAPVDTSWMPVLDSVHSELEQAAVHVLRVRARGARTFPADEQVLRALEVPLPLVRVLIVGQDPYPTAGNAVGLAFSVAPSMGSLPASLRNIFRELVDDLGVASPTTGDLTAWTEQGVLLLNRVLAVTEGEPGSLRGTGWEGVTLAVVRALNAARGESAAPALPLVAILWGADAGTLEPELDRATRILSAHPSPLSARRGFFGSRPFSRANEVLVAAGATPIDWNLSQNGHRADTERL